MEWQLRNWYYFTWLSGDHNVEQHVHSLDKMAWVMKDEYPVRAFGIGGRQVRTGPECGNIFDHHAVIYEFANGAKCFSMCRQQDEHAQRRLRLHLRHRRHRHPARHEQAQLLGDHRREALARSAAQRPRTTCTSRSTTSCSPASASSNPINDGDWMTKSTLMGIMGRMATYTGQEVTWEQALNSKEDLSPKHYAFGPNPVPPPAIPGVTKLV